jgi:hypothetical protein
MKQTPAFLALVVLLAACNGSSSTSNTDSTKMAADSSTIRPIQSPYDIMYSSKFVMDDPKNAESVLKFWKAFDNADFSTVKDLFADSFDVTLADGMKMHLSRDSTMSAVLMHRNSFAAVSSRVDAIMAVKSTDHDEHWALIWGSEKDTHKDGKIDSVELQETWRFNKNGQADLLFQYKQSSTPPPPPPMKKKK